MTRTQGRGLGDISHPEANESTKHGRRRATGRLSNDRGREDRGEDPSRDGSRCASLAVTDVTCHHPYHLSCHSERCQLQTHATHADPVTPTDGRVQRGRLCHVTDLRSVCLRFCPTGVGESVPSVRTQPHETPGLCSRRATCSAASPRRGLRTRKAEAPSHPPAPAGQRRAGGRFPGVTGPARRWVSGIWGARRPRGRLHRPACQDRLGGSGRTTRGAPGRRTAK